MRRQKWMVVAAVAIAACVDSSGTSDPNFAISDATHGSLGSRNAFFYWLPPLVTNPSPTGTANQFAEPVVTVCELTASLTGCAESSPGHPIIVAQFTKTSGTGGAVITVNGDGQYQVNWRTDLSNLDPAKVYRITVTVDDLAYGFADVEVGLTGKELKNVDQNLFVPLVDGRTLPIKFRIEAGAACAGRIAECAEAIVDPSVQTIVRVVDGDVPLAFGDFPAGWTTGPQLVRIERIPDAGFGPGEGPLATDFPQYPLFFHYFTSAPQPFNKKARIGVCNVEDPNENPYHPHHRESTVLAMGGTPETFRTLERAPVGDILGNCSGAERQEPPIGWLPARLNELATALFPKELHASVMVVDGGAGGSTDFFSPAGTVDTAAFADFTVGDLSVSPVGATTDQALTVSATITNAGGSSAGPATVNLCLVQFSGGGSSSTCYQPETPTLAAGASATFTQNFGTFPAGAWHAYASVDTFEVVAESNETNNSLLGPEFTITVGAISFETFPDGSPTCGNCALTDAFGSRGVVFSFSPVDETGECAAYTNAQLFLSSSAYDPAGGPPNHSATSAGQTGGGFCSGLVKMSFGGSPDTVRFRIRGNNGIALFPVDAFDAGGNLIPETQIVRSDVSAYTSVSGFSFRQETITIINAGGVSRVELDMNGFIVLIDNLLILP